ncbi:diguanylate cyclase [Halomonas sp. HMF6819]|uniref:sensor domain-containing diguanylate cyclase n=1 Tax=unclassified Halomonas TaxID=2609666 RepID=UPI0020766DDE|nr:MULTISPECIES: GGDEF domain-containing protein [unclassified Halomonas]
MKSHPAVGQSLYQSLTDKLPSFLSRSLRQTASLPSLPAVVMQVLEVARMPSASLKEYAGVIEHDPALTARLIAVANTAHHVRSPNPAITSFEATQRLGTDATLATVLSFALFKDEQTSDIALPTWQRAIASAAIASQLAQKCCPERLGQVFTVALLQDIGILALQMAYPEEAQALYAQRDLSHMELAKEERQRFGCDHTLIGAWLAAKWGLPESLVHIIDESHDSVFTEDPVALCVRFSGPLADAWLSPNAPQSFSTLLFELSSAQSEHVALLESLFHRMHQQIQLLSDLLKLAVPLPIESQSVLSEAKQLLFQHALSISARLEAQQERFHKLEKQHDALLEHSRLDPLTQLANRAWLEEQLKERFEICRQKQRIMSVVFIDLDHFKTLNDRYGHRIGDEVLQCFGKALLSLVDASDVAGRYGGEEFLIILPDETAQKALRLARRIMQLLEKEPMAFDNIKPLYVTVSIGIACMADGVFESEHELIAAADQSMYNIKRSGRSGVSIYGQ